MAKVLTIYGIGSGHTYVEQYNTLVELCNRTEADIKIVLINGDSINYARVYNGANSTELLPDNWADGKKSVCILVDGPGANPATANGYFESQFSLIKPLIDTFKPDVINAAGHSRGAIFCLFTINQLANTYKGKCNVFLIDPVNMSLADKDLALRLGPNISKYKRIVMEDEGSNKVFPPAEISSNGGPQIKETDNIRFPGTHGTATQLTPIVPNNYLLPDRKQFTLDGVWPIAKTTFLMIVEYLGEYGTDFISISKISNYQLIDSYAEIQFKNLIEYEGDQFKRLMNDTKLSMADQKSEVNLISLTGRRDEELLDKFCLNPYQFSPLFVDNEHADLFKKEFDDLFKILPEMVTSKKYFTCEFGDLVKDQKKFNQELADNGLARADCQELRLNCSVMFSRLQELLNISNNFFE